MKTFVCLSPVLLLGETSVNKSNITIKLIGFAISFAASKSLSSLLKKRDYNIIYHSPPFPLH
jgi:hypothetical protein